MRSGESSIFKVDKVVHAPCVRSRKTKIANLLESCSGIPCVAVEVCLYSLAMQREEDSQRTQSANTVSEHSQRVDVVTICKMSKFCG